MLIAIISSLQLNKTRVGLIIMVKKISLNKSLIRFQVKKPAQNTVTFKNGDNTHAAVKVETGKAIDTDALTDQSMPANPTKAGGYAFKEWNTKEDDKGETFTGASVVNGDMTVYAIYTKDSVPTPNQLQIRLRRN